MIGQAFGAELFKLSRNQWSLFWAFGFLPAFVLVAGIAEETLARTYVGDALPYANPVRYAYDGLGTMQPSIFQLFAILGAGILFAGEYRWETWRAILPRNERTAIMIAKLLLFALIAAASILACGLARWFVGLLDAALTGRADAQANSLIGLLTGFAGAFLQIMVTGALTMLTAVVSRSLMAAIVAPVMILVALDLSGLRFRLETGDPWLAALPNFAGRAIREAGLAFMGEPDAIGVHLAGPGAMAMAALTVLFAVTAIVLFRAQDLSRE